MSSETFQQNPFLVFVNHVDTFIGKNLVKCITELKSYEDQEEDQEGRDKELGYVVIGTKISEDENPKIERTLSPANPKEYLDEIKQCQFVIFNIIENQDQIPEAEMVIKGLAKDIDNLTNQVVFILLSSLMTWSYTKPLESDDTEITLNDEDFRRRKSHPAFRSHLDLEKEVTKAGTINKKKLKTHVLACGLVYGYEETVFHYWFRNAWNNDGHLVVFGKGDNIVPTIHVKDICSIVVYIMSKLPKKSYLVVCDESNVEMFVIVKAISVKLGAGPVIKVPYEDIYTTTEIPDLEAAMLSIDLRIEAQYVHDNFDFEWHSDVGMLENMSMLVREFKLARNLIPMKISILGPPGVGKTTVSKYLERHYKLHVLSAEMVLEDFMKSTEEFMKKVLMDDADEEGKEFEEEPAADEELFNNIKEQLEADGVVDEDTYNRLFKSKTLSNECQNQGFILDDWPRTMEQAAALFNISEGDEDEEEDHGKEDDQEEDEDDDPNRPTFNKKTMPDMVILLDADDEYLIERVINMPEELVQQIGGDKYTEEGFQTRLSKYRATNSEELSVVNFFDMKEVHPLVIDATKDKSNMYELSCKHIINLLGKPRNYGLTHKEMELKRYEEEEAKRLEDERKLAADKKLLEEEEEIAKKYKEEWEQKVLEIKQQEEELLENESLPLRNYLMKYIMPTLTKGLLEVTNVRPDDPIDYLAEYLFKQTTI